MAENCGQIDLLPLLTSCPADTEQLLFFNTNGNGTGMALRSWATIKNCILCGIFGPGVLEITGADLDGSGIYLNSELVSNLKVFACNIPNFLEEGTQWDYVLNGSGAVLGIQILIGYDAADRFLIFPDPTCEIE